MRRPLIRVLVGLVWAPGLPAQAQQAAEIHYRAPAGCPDEREFMQAVLQRSSPPASVQISAVIEAEGASHWARLRLQRPGQADFIRSLTARTCGEAVSALALVCAMALEAPAEPPPRMDPPSPAPVVEGVEEAEPPPPASTDAPTAAAPEQPGPRVDAGLHVALDGEASPFFGVHFQWPLLRMVTLSFALGTGASPSSPVGTAAYTRMLVRLDACPLELEHRALLQLFGCGRIEGGPLVIRYSGQSTVHPLFSAGLIANARWLPTRWFFVELQGGAIYALARKQAGLGGAALLPDPPPLTPRLALGAGVQIP